MSNEPARTEHLILIVEDQDEIRTSLRSVLDAGGYRAVEASTGTEALEIARTLRPDMILLDLGLPEMNGLDVAQLLNREAETASIPIVALTGSWLGSDPVALADVGFVGALRKPFRAPTLLAEVSRVLGTAEHGHPDDVFHNRI
jgi:CheY-like chemotaxis protein